MSVLFSLNLLCGFIIQLLYRQIHLSQSAFPLGFLNIFVDFLKICIHENSQCSVLMDLTNVRPCFYHHNNIEQLYHSKISPKLTLQQSAPLPPHIPQPVIHFQSLHHILFLFQKVIKWNDTTCTLLCLGHFTQQNAINISIFYVKNYLYPFIAEQYCIVWTQYRLFSNLPDEGHVGCFQLLAVMNICVYNLCEYKL